ncbi:MAG: hypothetical protein Q4G47_08605 [Lachnospiraceae bacterium]|nr:hypothetical protein [Lachnospiraceae bacterium]
MRKILRKIIPLLLIAVMLFSVSASAYAATYPTAALLSKTTQTYKRGSTASVKLRLRSNSYTKYGSIWRSECDVRIYYNSTGELVASNGNDGVWFTGVVTYTAKWKIPASYPKGTYRVNYRTYYNKSTSGYKWYYNKYTTNKNCYIKVT